MTFILLPLFKKSKDHLYDTLLPFWCSAQVCKAKTLQIDPSETMNQNKLFSF